MKIYYFNYFVYLK